jgi:predicted HTH domain antitoxin
MQVRIDLPDDVSQALKCSWGDLSRRALEALAVEGYRSGALSESQVRRMLDIETRVEVHAFLKSHGVPLAYTEGELAEDLEAHRELGILPPA